jgi:2-polyprenyl-3-methyl-5-hydroxy-6-metoxy-1,4-benzoquinol methylase
MHAPLAQDSVPSPLQCVVCRAQATSEPARTQVRSNVKRFQHESFEVWQCEACRSIHAVDEVDLDHYYAHYPFHSQRMTFPTRLAFRSKLRALEKLGITRDQKLLDYGCGSGLFVRFLQQQGFTHAHGYDAYASEGPYAGDPGTGYDVIISQDVIEHVADPRAYLETLIALVRPGALLVIGTPNAQVVDMDAPDQHIHMLHQPYHRHILSLDALVVLAKEVGLEIAQVKHGFQGNSAFPGLNGRFLRRLLRANGDTLDDTLAGNLALKWELFTPAALWDACTGAFRDPGYDLTVAFRVRA